MRVLLVDDEKPARDELRFLLENFNDIDVAYEAGDGYSAITKFNNDPVDVVFLDIQMPELSGIEVARILMSGKKSPIIIFITAYDSYAVQAFELHAVDYLLKPIEKERLALSLERVREALSKHSKQELTLKGIQNLLQSFQQQNRNVYITVCDDERYFPIAFDDVKYIYADDKKTFIITTRGKFCYKNTLNKIEELLPDNFIRIHRSYIININFIKHVEAWFNGAYQVFIKNEPDPVMVSRSHAKSFKESIKMN